MANKKAEAMRPNPITVDLEGTTYTIVYDMNAFIELEKIYDSIDELLQMLLGSGGTPDLTKVTHKDKPINPDEVLVDGIPLSTYLERTSQTRKAKHEDTLNLLWAGCLHEYTEWNTDDEIVRYTITKAKLGKLITFKNIRYINVQILTAILQDLVPEQADDAKNEPVLEALPPA